MLQRIKIKNIYFSEKFRKNDRKGAYVDMFVTRL